MPRAFEAAARHLSFKQAAHDLHVTAGAVSQQIRLLEERLGVQLFERRGRAGVNAPARGEFFIPSGRAACWGEGRSSWVAHHLKKKKPPREEVPLDRRIVDRS